MKRAAGFVLLVVLAVAVAATAGNAARRVGAKAPAAAAKPKPKHGKHKKKPPHPPLTFTVTADEAGWHHFGPGESEACARFTVSPPQPQAEATISFGAKGTPPEPQAIAPDFAGIKTQTFFYKATIEDYGVYTFTLTVTSNGITSSASIDDDVQPSPDLVPPCT